MANPWRKGAVSDEVWYWLLEYGYKRGVMGYNNRVTLDAILRDIKEHMETCTAAQGV